MGKEYAGLLSWGTLKVGIFGCSSSDAHQNNQMKNIDITIK
jgi:hypothetical protein